MDQVIELCEKGEYTQALTLIEGFERQGKISSDLYRIKGHAQMMMGEYDDAIDNLIEALKLDPRNESALILVGNIYAIQKQDVTTAMTYFKKVLDLNSTNYIGLSNIAGIIAKQGKIEEAKDYFFKALEVRSDHAPALYGLALVEKDSGNLLDAFEYARQATIAARVNKDQKMVEASTNLALSFARKYLTAKSGSQIYDSFLKDLETHCNREIDVQIDPSLKVPAKIRIAEYHGLPKHQILIREDSSSIAYYVLHELMHLFLISEARQVSENELFTSSESTYRSFRRRVDKYTKTIVKNGIPNESLERFFKEIYNGLLLQVYNAPIDLFIEQRIFQTKEYRPIQLLGLMEMIQPAIQAATDKKLSKIVPSFVRDANIILTCTQLIQIRDLYGIDLLDSIKDAHLINRAKTIYKDFEDMQQDKSPAEEYDLIRWWSEELELDKFFNLEKEF